MALASLNDVNVHLPDDKLFVEDGSDNKEQLDTVRIVRGELSTTFSAGVLALWDSPENTPEYIRAAAGRLVAALYYARAFSLEELREDNYAQKLYNEAMMMLARVKTGDVVLGEVTEVVNTGAHLDRDNFWPNADTAETASFRVGDRW